ncbi:cytochrome P450 [Streptantibioticus ferralitis]|uniref:Cytochrome P450 n=1 Tax=Streptantibioticus ferralitis TaxID=236510 RepID=A0ABT5Z8F0_9ACTN|nr:cytochrome P450 [Streptantibioticus ferralitis]MDF2260107.1 cytochrome P450 [Streptantibioticus ferralitis]
MNTTCPEPVAYPFGSDEGLALSKAYSDAREADGLIRVRLPYGEPAWLATRYADARLVLGDPRFSRALAEEHDPPRARKFNAQPKAMFNMDAPDHTRLRRLISKAFTIRRVEELRPKVRDLAHQLIDDMVAAGPPADLVEDFALPIPVVVICELLGVPVEDRPRFRGWTDAILSTSSLTAEEGRAKRGELVDYIREIIAARRAAPADDLISAMIEARDVEDKLTEMELLDHCVGLLIAGHETTASQIPSFVFALLEQPEHWARLRDDPELIPAAVEELFRFVPLGSGSAAPRYAKEDIDVGGTLVRAGEPVLVALGAANRDALRFEDPEEIRLDRTNNQHIGFGYGIHHCLGAPLARLELQEALRALLSMLPNLRVAGDITWKSEMLVRGPRTMPVGW